MSDNPFSREDDQIVDSALDKLPITGQEPIEDLESDASNPISPKARAKMREHIEKNRDKISEDMLEYFANRRKG